MGKRITNEEFIKRMKDVNPNILIQSEYLGSHSYIKCKCLRDNNIWEALATNLLSGKGCPRCSFDKHQRTNAEYIKLLHEINPNLIALESYTYNNIPIKHKCIIDGCIFTTKPSTIISGHGCPECAGNKYKTTEEYLRELNIIHPNIVPIEEYVNTGTKIKHKCLIHNYEWDISPNCLLTGGNCPICSGALLTHEVYVERVKLINPNIEIIDRYINASTPIKHRCKIDDYVWYPTPNSILGGKGCPKCYGNIKKTHEQFMDEFKLINPNIIILGEYNGANTKIKCKCKKDGCIWYPMPSKLLIGVGCPICKKSKGESRCSKWFNINNIDFVSQYSFDDLKYKKQGTLKFDFAIFNKQNELICLCEYDGIQHYKPVDYAGKGKEWAIDNLKKTKLRDAIKNKYCETNNIKLIRIPYWEFNNIEYLLKRELAL